MQTADTKIEQDFKHTVLPYIQSLHTEYVRSESSVFVTVTRTVAMLLYILYIWCGNLVGPPDGEAVMLGDAADWAHWKQRAKDNQCMNRQRTICTVCPSGARNVMTLLGSTLRFSTVSTSCYSLPAVLSFSSM